MIKKNLVWVKEGTNTTTDSVEFFKEVNEKLDCEGVTSVEWLREKENEKRLKSKEL